MLQGLSTGGGAFRICISSVLVVLGFISAGCQQPAPKGEDTDEVAERSEQEPAQKSVDEAPSPYAECPRGEAPACDVVLWLSCYQRQQVADIYCSECTDGPGCEGGGAQTDAELVRREKLEYFPCEESGYAIAALQAWHGKPVEDSSWKAYVESRDWYREVDEAPMSQTATANMAMLRDAQSRCLEQSDVTAEDRAFVASWFETLQETGEAPKAPAEFVGGETASTEQFDKFIAHLVDDVKMEFDRRTPVFVDPKAGKVMGDGPDYARSITVKPSLTGQMACGGEHCDGYESLTFYLDEDGNLVAQHVTAAG